ncbi:Na+/H+ antiporter subunit A [Lysinibacillus sp. fkY74-1]|uniref:Multiple resistance and pH homeostasis (Na+/H+ antiporter) n=4 Tax=Bacillaceae TaxID=186817 RepID=B1HXD6_LYSSC|nr:MULTISPECIES: Na+/H+ antiporter subunit A [Lysinibacillus]ACA38231.1 multiple resistance and pH homeostasis (Na+/H+ antiporter) [Lysinibacillus sphaericus C3-41]EWH30654.1 cation:proton antiporter [Lysinibacillus sphaericus CBAM5]MBI6862873.1 Na+/H+ antiporter subunit A [Lysinibacillus fusiformis]MCS1395555.1 Na+/H+ antiporter subunit A [Lysinibacillus sp. PB211]MDM5352278.1 Na+/H+ antiporter subunit A [Lysinibacillus sphaericus]
MLQVLYIFIPMLAAIFVPFLYKSIKNIHTGWFVLAVPATLVVIYASYIAQVAKGGVFTAKLPWIPSLDISFVSYLDGLSLLFSLLITGIGSLVVLYSIFYLDKHKEKLHNFYVYLLLFMSAMLGVVQSDHLITLYFFWELTSISSFLLIGYWYNRDASRLGALKSMMITVGGGLMMLGGFVLLYLMGGTYSIRELMVMAPNLVDHPLFTWSLVLLLLGAFTKSAQFPFYIWLPDAMEAPTPVSAYLHSATMVKAGIYLVARFTPIFAASELWVWLVTGIGILTLFWGSFFAVKQTDLKGILAFSTVSQLGLIMSLLGASAVAFHANESVDTIKFAAFAAIFHLINHATFKGSLFMIAGIIDHETGTRDIRKLGGLMSIMPISFTVAAIGSLSMAGLPPFNGFLSKEMFLTAMLALQKFEFFGFDTWGVLFPIVAWVASIFTFIYSFYFVFRTFNGNYKPEQLPHKPHEAPIGMLVSPMLLAGLVVLIFFIPNFIGDTFVKPAVLAIQPFLYEVPQDIDIHVSAWHGINPELLMTIGIIIIGVLLFVSLPKWQGMYQRFPKAFTLNNAYDKIMQGLDVGLNRLSRLYMTGSMRHYLLYMFSGIAIIVIGSLFVKNAFSFSFQETAPIRPYEIILVVVLLIGTAITILAKSRLTAIIGLGSVGYTVALFFVIFNAPDLALTQLVIETISVALFLMAFYHLPKLGKREERMRFQLNRAVVSITIGAMVTLVALSAHSQKLIPSISKYYEETVYSLAGGGNIVNVILVDYRGFDTLFEITVLGIAGMAILAMIKLRMNRKEKTHENK